MNMIMQQSDVGVKGQRGRRPGGTQSPLNRGKAFIGGYRVGTWLVAETRGRGSAVERWIGTFPA